MFSDTAGNNLTSVNDLTFQLTAHLDNCTVFFRHPMLIPKMQQNFGSCYITGKAASSLFIKSLLQRLSKDVKNVLDMQTYS